MNWSFRLKNSFFRPNVDFYLPKKLTLILYAVFGLFFFAEMDPYAEEMTTLPQLFLDLDPNFLST